MAEALLYFQVIPKDVILHTLKPYFRSERNITTSGWSKIIIGVAVSNIFVSGYYAGIYTNMTVTLPPSQHLIRYLMFLIPGSLFGVSIGAVF